MTTKFAKDIDKLAVLVESKKLYDNQVPDWIATFFKEKGFQISPEASNMLSENIGNDLNRIANEVNKMLLNFTGQAKIKITEEHISKNIGISREFNVFELQKALGAKNVTKANQIVMYFASNPKNNPVIPIIASLFGFFSKILIVHMSEDKAKDKLAAALKLNPYFVDEFIHASKRYPFPKLLQIFHHLRTADLRSKGINSTASDDAILKELIFNILN